MTSHVRVIVEFSVVEGKIDAFKKVAADVIERVEANEPNTLNYEFFFSDDLSKGFLVELYKDSEAVMAHLANVGEMLEPLHALSQTSGITVSGSPSDEVKQLFEPFGSKYYEYWNGFRR